MLSLGKLAPGQQQYYLDTVAKGAEEYYTGAKEAPGEWHGAAAIRLGLHGEVDADALGAVLAHDHPGTGEHLTRGRSHPDVAGFDATFSAPKSVSLVFALGDPEASNEVRNSHDTSVRQALGFLEDHSSVGRRGRGGLVSIGGDGFVAAAFRHRTSRAAEPQLHTHVVIANLVHSPDDGRWTALDARPLYRWCRPVGHLYEAHLRWELTTRLGVAWTPVRNGIADIAGIPSAAIEAFSTRRRQILEHLDAHGTDGGRAAQVAAYATRNAKDTAATPENLLDTWRATAAEHGLDHAVLAGALRRHRVAGPPSPGSPEADALFRQLAAPDALTARRSTFGRGEVIEAICDRLPDGGRVSEIVALTEAFLASQHVVPVVHAPEPLIDDFQERWTTPEMLTTEARLLDIVENARTARTGIIWQDHLDATLASRPSLDAGQQKMIRQVCRSGAGIDVVDGVAGSGKTYALSAAHQGWTTAGYRVRGACLAARAAQRLEEGSGIPSTTIDRLERSLRHSPLTSTDVVVIDEAGMVGTRALLRLAEQSSKAGAKLVLIGDPRQLPEIDAGGTFGHLTRRHEAAHLDTNRRQVEPWERDALAELRHGSPDKAYDDYARHGRIHHGPDVRNRMVNAWFRSRGRGEEALMAAAHLRAVDDLNRRARVILRQDGQIGPDVIRANGRDYAVGDEITALRNDYNLGVLNGTHGTIHGIDLDRRLLVVDTDHDGRTEIPFAYVTAGDLTHGYATTIRKAQGATVDRCFVLVEEQTSREHAYTAMSRGRLSNDLYVEGTTARPDECHAHELSPDAIERLRRQLRRSIGQRLAIDQLSHAAPELEIDDGVSW